MTMSTEEYEELIALLKKRIEGLEEDLEQCQETLNDEFLTRPPGTTPTTAYTDMGKPYPGY